jgi:hypothetical protein
MKRIDGSSRPHALQLIRADIALPMGQALFLVLSSCLRSDVARFAERSTQLLDRLAKNVCSLTEQFQVDLSTDTALTTPDPMHGTVVVPSDRGGQFRATSFLAVLRTNDLVGSMGRVSSAGDNAAMESFNVHRTILHPKWIGRLSP